jgi:hypothetical protein
VHNGDRSDLEAFMDAVYEEHGAARLSLRIEPTLKRELQRIADRNERTLSRMVAHCLKLIVMREKFGCSDPEQDFLMYWRSYIDGRSKKPVATEQWLSKWNPAGARRPN